MKTIYLFAAMIISSQVLFAQAMTVYKTDQSAVSFQLSDIDSLSFTTTAPSAAENLPGKEFGTDAAVRPADAAQDSAQPAQDKKRIAAEAGKD